MDPRGVPRLLAALDTNVLVSAEGLRGAGRQERAKNLISTIPPSLLVVPAQVICELFNVLVRKARRDPIDARRAAAIWQDSYLVIPTTETVLGRAFGIAVDHHLATWDAVILAAASEAGCRALLSEDIKDGFTWGGVAVVNPFAPTPHNKLDDLRAGFR